MSWLGLLLMLLLTSCLGAEGVAASSAPIADLTIVKDRAVLFSYTPADAKDDNLTLDASSVEQFFKIVKTPIRGDVDFKFQRCAWTNVSSVQPYDPDGKNLTTKTRTVWSVAWLCRDFKDGGYKLNKADVVRLIVVPGSEKYDPLTGDYLVWEDLYVGGQLVPDASWWTGRPVYQCLNMSSYGANGGPGGAGNTVGEGSLFWDDGNVTILHAHFDGYDTYSGTVYFTIGWANGTDFATSSTEAWGPGAGPVNFTFATPVFVSKTGTGNYYRLIAHKVTGANIVEQRMASAAWPHGSLFSDGTEYTAYDWAIDAFCVSPAQPPSISLSGPSDGANGSCANATTFSFVPISPTGFGNISLWTNETGWSRVEWNQSVVVNATVNNISYAIADPGCVLWSGRACDNAEQCVFAPTNRTFCWEECPGQTTTTTICGNGTCCPWPTSPLEIRVGGFQWFVLFFIILVTCLVLGGLVVGRR